MQPRECAPWRAPRICDGAGPNRPVLFCGAERTWLWHAGTAPAGARHGQCSPEARLPESGRSRQPAAAARRKQRGSMGVPDAQPDVQRIQPGTTSLRAHGPEPKPGVAIQRGTTAGRCERRNAAPGGGRKTKRINGGRAREQTGFVPAKQKRNKSGVARSGGRGDLAERQSRGDHDLGHGCALGIAPRIFDEEGA